MCMERCEQCGNPLPKAGWNGPCPQCLVGVSLGSFLNDSENGGEGIEGGSLGRDDAGKSSGSDGGGLPRRLGGYELLEEIGRGGMGVVYRARQVALGRVVAVKTLRVRSGSSDAEARRFQSEASIVASLQHPNIVRVYESGIEGECLYFSMEFVEGPTLASMLAEHPMEPVRVAGCLADVAGAVHYAHGQGVLHRDLKPGNILMDSGVLPRVTDFGLAKRLAGGGGKAPTGWTPELTRAGSLLGTPSYMAPEQLRSGRGESGPPCDVYSLGAVLYHALTGRPPFLTADVESTLLQVIDQEPTPLRAINPAIPWELDAICLKCLEKDPGRRYATAGELEADLRRFLRHEPIEARRISKMGRVWRWSRRHPAPAALAIALLGTLCVGLVAGILVSVTLARLRTQERVARVQAEASEWGALQNAYSADIRLAQQALTSGNSAQAVLLLSRYEPGSASGKGWSQAMPKYPSVDEIKKEGLHARLRGWEWHYLWNRCRSDELATLGRHPQAVDEVLCFPDGRRAVSADRGGTVILWDLDDLSERARAEAGGSVLAMAVTRDLRRLATGTWNRGEKTGGVQVWDVDGLVPSGPSGFHANPVTALRFDSGGSALVACDHEYASRWSVPEMNLQSRVPADIGWQAAFSSDGEYLVNGISRGRLTVLETQGWSEVARMTNSSVRSQPVPVWIGTSHRIASVSGQSRIPLWSPLESGGEGRVVESVPGALAVVASPDGRWLAAAGDDLSIHLVDMESLQVRRVLHGHRSRVSALDVSADGRRLVSGDRDGVVKVWSTSDRVGPSDRIGIQAIVGAYNPDSVLNAVMDEGASNSRRLEFARELVDAAGRHLEAGTQFGEFSVGGEWSARSGSDGIRVLLSRRGVNGMFEEVGELTAEDLSERRPVEVRIFFAADARSCFVMRKGGFLERWDVGTRRRSWIVQLRKDSSPTWALGLDRTRRIVAIGFGDGSVEIRNLENGARLASMQADSRFCTAAGLSSDGTLAAAAGSDGVARVWSLATGESEPRRVAQLGTGTGVVQALALSPDNRRLAVGNNLGEIHVWDLIGERELLEVSPAVEAAAGRRKVGVSGLAFTPDGRHLYSVTEGELRVWAGEGD